MHEVTQILQQIDTGDSSAADRLLPLIYNELRKLAAARLKQENPGHTLQATALVHEVYLKLVDREQQKSWQSRGHFFSAAAEAMRQILLDAARRKKRLKRGGGHVVQLEFPEEVAEAPGIQEDVLTLSDALDKLAQKDARKAELVKLRYFAGLTIEQAAAALGIGVSTADRDWSYARLWLYREMTEGTGNPPD